MRRCRIAIVEPSEIVAEGLKSILSQGIEYEIVSVCADLRMLIERIAIASPDVVVVNSQLVSSIQQPIRLLYAELQSVALVALSAVVCEDEVMRQFDGVINIFDTRQQILRRIAVAIEQNQTNPYSDSHDLSERERDVLILVARGMSNKEIADELNISIHTVMSHRKNITHKTGIKSVAGLTVYALLNNLIDQADVNF